MTKDERADGTIPLHEHADDNIQYIRNAIERANVFTAVPGWGMVAIGVLGMVVGGVGQSVWNDQAWIGMWVLTAAVSFAIGMATMARKIRAQGMRLFAGAGARFWAGLLPTLIAGALITIPLQRAGMTDLLPTVWLLLYGAAVITAGASSVRLVPMMGICFMLSGAIAMFGQSRDAAMATGFGGLHVLFGYIIARKYGG